jgi:hypothetical protein
LVLIAKQAALQVSSENADDETEVGTPVQTPETEGKVGEA